MLGMNDCASGEAGRGAFRKGMTAIVDEARAVGAIPLLHTPNTIYAAERREPLRPAGLRASRPRGRGLPGMRSLIDHYEHWSRAKPKQDDLLAWLEDRSIHPNAYGHPHSPA